MLRGRALGDDHQALSNSEIAILYAIVFPSPEVNRIGRSMAGKRGRNDWINQETWTHLASIPSGTRNLT